MNKFLLSQFLCALLCACSHTIRLPTSDFMTPVVSEHIFGGRVGIGIGSSTEVSLTNDISTNPPTRNQIYINQDISGLIWIPSITSDFSLALLPHAEIYCQNGMAGAKWQIVTSSDKGFQLAIKGGAGSWEESLTTAGTDTTSVTAATAKLGSTEAGLSLGYSLSADSTPYLSFTSHKYSSRSNISNAYGAFNFDDSGRHDIVSLGILFGANNAKGIFETNFVDALWERGKRTTQQGIGFELTYNW